METARVQNAKSAGMSDYQKRRIWTAFFFTLPAFIVFILLKYYPMLQAIYMSFLITKY